jgi:hypothetical protein
MAPTKAQKAAAARARANRHPQKPSSSPKITFEIIAEDPPCLPSPIIVDDPEEDFDECGYAGGVNVSSDSESDYEPSEDEWMDSDTESLAELEGDKLENNLRSLREETQQLSVPTPYAKILKKKTTKEWATAELCRGLGYNGLSDRTGRRNVQKAREREEE